jgi:hypothetical protein
MKGFISQVDGPIGPWMKKVNAAIAAAQSIRSSAELEKLLGPPDVREDLEDDDRRETDDGPIVPSLPDELWIYGDPYRPKRTYRFLISRGQVVNCTRADSF